MLFPTKVSQISCQQFTAAHPTAVVIQIVVHQIGVVGIDSGVFGVLVFCSITLVIFIKDVVIEDEGVAGIREKLQ